MKIAVVGGGVFGCMSAIKLSEAGHKVTLFEENSDLLQGASGINQYRLHRGYHYPRSIETVEYVQESVSLFEKEFPWVICRGSFKRYYGISSQGSLISSQEYLSFLDWNHLPFRESNLPFIKEGSLDLLVEVIENGFDVDALRSEIWRRLNKCDVRLNENYSGEYDVTVNATYANINRILPEEFKVDYQFELCEKPVVSLPLSYLSKSVVILDGDFCCVDPFGFNTGQQVLGHVKEAIHDRQIGKEYNVIEGYAEVLNSGIVQSNLSRFTEILEGFKQFFQVDNYTYCGSMYTVRTVLPNREHDDARPSNIIKHRDNLYSIFSGKIGTCVDIANKLVKMI